MRHALTALRLSWCKSISSSQQVNKLALIFDMLAKHAQQINCSLVHVKRKRNSEQHGTHAVQTEQNENITFF